MNHLANIIRRITVFCIKNRGKCFVEGESAALLFRYMAHQLLTGSLFVDWKGSEPEALVVVWREDAAALIEREKLGRPQFNWQLPSKSGDCALIGPVIGNRKSVARLLGRIRDCWPDAASLRLFTYRNSRLRELNWKTLERFAI